MSKAVKPIEIRWKQSIRSSSETSSVQPSFSSPWNIGRPPNAWILMKCAKARCISSPIGVWNYPNPWFFSLTRLTRCWGTRWYAFELKLMDKTALEKGKNQLAGYLKRLGLDSGWLILFQRGEVEDVEALGEEETIQHQNKTLRILKL